MMMIMIILPRQLNDDHNDVCLSNFKLHFMMQIIYCIIHIFLYSLFIFLFSYIVSKKQGIERILTLPYL